MRAALAGAVLAMCAACVPLSELTAPASMPLEQAAVAAAVVTTITANHADAAEQKARAARIVTIAREVLTLDTGASMALADVEIIVNSKVAQLNLPPADALLADMLVAMLGAEMQRQLALSTTGAVSPTTQVAIAAVCRWVIVDAGGTV
jgi:hypothetical protein